MTQTPFIAAAAAIVLAGAAAAEAPRVAVDIAPVHSIVARVMEGAGAPDLIVPPGASPHEHALRPSAASALQEADMVIWIGPELTPRLGGALASLAPEAERVTLLAEEATRLLPLREGAVFGAGGHDDHDDHDDHAGHGEEEEHGHAHEAGGVDAHAWLSPANAAGWAGLVAERLAAADPGNAALYRANAARAAGDIAALEAEIDAVLAPVRGRRFVVFHDAYGYFEEAFDMPAAGAISVSDASRPSPGRIAELRDHIAGAGVTCVLAEPQFNPGLVSAVSEGAGVRTATVDPLGSTLEPGPALYERLLRDMARALAGCL